MKYLNNMKLNEQSGKYRIIEFKHELYTQYFIEVKKWYGWKIYTKSNSRGAQSTVIFNTYDSALDLVNHFKSCDKKPKIKVYQL